MAEAETEAEADEHPSTAPNADVTDASGSAAAQPSVGIESVSALSSGHEPEIETEQRLDHGQTEPQNLLNDINEDADPCVDPLGTPELSPSRPSERNHESSGVNVSSFTSHRFLVPSGSRNN